MKKSRAEKAGEKMGESIIEMMNLMYQNNTAKNFLEGLTNVLYKKETEYMVGKGD